MDLLRSSILASERVQFRGVTVDARTREMLLWAERLARSLGFDGYLEFSQGSYTTANAKSGGTHAGGGVVDVRAADRTAAERSIIVRALRLVGFAAWLRRPDQDPDFPPWPYHVHAVAIGCRELSPQAAWQVTEYKAGRNGLARQGADDGPRVVWTEYPQELGKMQTITDEDIKALTAHLAPAVGRWLLDTARVPDTSTPEPGDVTSVRKILMRLNALSGAGEPGFDAAAILAEIDQLPTAAEIRAELAAALAT